MTIRHLLWTLTVASLVAATGCAGGKNVASSAPEWTFNSPVLPAHYVGIGSASKLIHPLDADAVAKQQALDNMSRDIRVQVQSSSTVSTLQINGWLSESFSAQSTSTTQEDLEGFELVDTYSTETEVLVYYRLSKAKHAQIQAAKRAAAMDLALGHLDAATQARAQANVQQAVDAAIRGLDAVRPFMDKPLVATRPSGEEVNVPQALISILDGSMTGLALATPDSAVTLHVANQFRTQLDVAVLLDGQPASNVRINYRYHRGDLPTRGTATSDARGVAAITLEKFEPGVTGTTLEVQVDPMAFVEGLPLVHPFRQAARGLTSAPLRIDVKLAPVDLVLQVEERAFGKRRDQDILGPSVRQALQQADVRLVQADQVPSAMVLTLEADARPGGGGQGLQTVYVDMVGTVTDAEGSIVYTQTMTRIKGIQMDLPRATDAAYDKATEQLQDEFIPELVRLWHGF